MKQDFLQIVQNHQQFFNSNTTKSLAFRKKKLKKLKKILQENEELLFEAIYQDFKKSKYDTFSSELLILYKSIDSAISKMGQWARRKKVGTNILSLPGKSYIYPEPLGTVLVIGAWNYPYLLSWDPVIAAIAAGNTVVLKPSEIPSQTSKVIAKLVNENFNECFFSVIEGGVEETTALLELKWDKIFFTGSTTVGRIVYQAAAKNLTPVTLELGGKSPVIVTKSADLSLAVKRIVWGKFLNAGQTCIAPDYVLINENVKDEFLKLLKERILEMDFSYENLNYPQIINERNYQRLKAMVDEDKIYYAGEFNESERLFPPVILDEVEFTDKVMEEEIFGPILPVLSYKKLSEAIEEIKSRPKPLACYVFTGDKSKSDRVIEEISFGGGAVNDTLMHISNNNLPFGGVGASGIGSYHGKAGFDTFTHYKSIVDKATWIDPKLRYNIYTEKIYAIMRRIAGVR